MKNPSHYIAAICFAASLSGASSALAQGSDQDTEFKPAGLEQLSMNSISCTGFWKTPGFHCDKIVVPVYVAKAKDGNHNSLVLISHGSIGLDKRHSDYAHYLADHNINAAVVGHWAARGVSKIHLDYMAARAKGADAPGQGFDLLALATQFKAMPEWKDAKFGHIGESMGGSAAINVTRPYIKSVVREQMGLDAPEFSAVVALYPGCIDRNTIERFKPVPLLIMVGTKDDDTPADTCERQTKWMNERGGTVEFVTLPGESHDFDAPYRLSYARMAQNPAKCENLRDGDHFTLLLNNKQFPGTPEGAKEMRESCFTLGLWSGHRGDPKTGYSTWLAFFKAKLRDTQ